MPGPSCVTHVDRRWSRRDAVFNQEHSIATKGWWIGPFRDELEAKHKQWSEEELVLLTRAGYPSFQHFVLDPLVNVVAHQYIIPHAKPVFNYLIPDETKVYQLAGGDSKRIMSVPDSNAACSKKGVWFNLVVALSPPRNPLDPYHRLPFQHAMIVSHFERIFKASRVPVPKRRRVVYLQRGKKTPDSSSRLYREISYREVANEELVLKAMREYLAEHSQDLELVVFSALKYSFEETVDIMRSADLIIGVHGGAMANAIFAPSNATIIEFCRAKQGDPPWTSYFSNGLETRTHICVQRRLVSCDNLVTSIVDLDELVAALDLWRTGKRPDICHETKKWRLIEDPIVAKLRQGAKKQKEH